MSVELPRNIKANVPTMPATATKANTEIIMGVIVMASLV
jgi:hypothetical protein